MKIRDRLILGIATFLLLVAVAWWLFVPAPAPPGAKQTNRATDLRTSKTSPASIAKTPQPKPLPVPDPQASAPPDNPHPQKKFSEMPVLERGKIMKEIRVKDIDAIFQHFLDAGRVENDPMKQGAVQLCLADALRDRPSNPVFLKKLQEFIESDEASKFERRMALGALSFAATKETVGLLIHEALNLTDKEMRDSAVASVRDVGDIVNGTLVRPLPPQSIPATTTNPVPKKKWNEVSLAEGGAIMAEIAKKDMSSIFQHFLDAGRVENDLGKQGAVRNLLEYGLRDRKPDPAFLKKLQEFIESDEPSKLERGMMIGILANAGTKEAAELLIHEAINLEDKELRGTAIAGLGNIGYGVEKDDFTPKLTAMWFATNDPKTMLSSAESLGRIGSSSGVEVLLTAALAPDGKDDLRREKAAYGLLKVNQPSAVPPLAAVLEKNPAGSQANTVAFRTLNQIGDKTASEAVMKWFQTTDSSAAAQAKEWAAHIRTTAQEQAAQSALDSKVRFRSEENRKALRAGLEAHREGRISSGR